jgi:hypothetical protein
VTRKPQRSTRDGQAYLDLQNLARRQGRLTDELLQIYALEGFLTRLATSPHAAKLILKGGVLLAAYQLRRPTRDVDLQGMRFDNTVDAVQDLVTDIARQPHDDGIIYDLTKTRAEIIRDEDVYSGVRVNLNCSLARAKLPFHVDVNVGDPIWPAPQVIELPRLLGGTITLSGFPLAMVHAEKIVTAIQRGMANTRWRDFADIHLLSGRHPIDAEQLRGACKQVAAYRATPLATLADALDGYADLAQNRWASWRQKQRLDQRLPAQFSDILAAVIDFADPALTGAAIGKTWSPHTRSWTATEPSTPARRLPGPRTGSVGASEETESPGPIR